MTRQNSTNCHTRKLEPNKQTPGNAALQISEIIGIIPAAAMPQHFDVVEGVGAINFQGKIIPIVDLRMNLYIQSDDCAEQICILVMETADTAESFMLAVLVDSELDAYQLVMETTH